MKTSDKLREGMLQLGSSLATIWLSGCFVALLLAGQTAGVQIYWSVTILLIYSLILGAITAGLFWLDKERAQAEERRIPEATLHLLSLLGGWSGSFLAQRWLRHKTQKLAFQASAWMGLSIQILALFAVAGWSSGTS